MWGDGTERRGDVCDWNSCLLVSFAVGIIVSRSVARLDDVCFQRDGSVFTVEL